MWIVSATLDSLNHRAKRPGVPGPGGGGAEGGGGGGGSAPKKKKKIIIICFFSFCFFFSFFFLPPPPPPPIPPSSPVQRPGTPEHSPSEVRARPTDQDSECQYLYTYVKASGLRPRNKIINTLRLTTEEQPHTAHHLYDPPL